MYQRLISKRLKYRLSNLVGQLNLGSMNLGSDAGQWESVGGSVAGLSEPTPLTEIYPSQKM